MIQRVFFTKYGNIVLYNSFWKFPIYIKCFFEQIWIFSKFPPWRQQIQYFSSLSIIEVVLMSIIEVGVGVREAISLFLSRKEITQISCTFIKILICKINKIDKTTITWSWLLSTLIPSSTANVLPSLWRRSSAKYWLGHRILDPRTKNCQHPNRPTENIKLHIKEL